MTASNTPDQRIDELLRSYSVVRYDNPNGIYAHSDYDVVKLKQDLKSLFETICLEVVGDNQHSKHREWDCPCGVTHSFTEEWHATNKLRDEQRQRIPQVISKYFNTEEK